MKIYARLILLTVKKKQSALALSHTYRAAAVVTREQQCRQPLNISDAGPILHRYHTAYT